MKTRIESAKTKSAKSIVSFRFFASFLCPQKARSIALLLLVTCCAPIAAYADVGGVPKDVADLQVAVATVQTQVVTLQSANTSLLSAVGALQAQVANLESVKTALLSA